VDDYIAADAGSRAAFLQAVGMSAKATAVVAATIASYLPIPGLASAGDLALLALGEQGAGETAVALGLGIIPGGKLAKLFAQSGVGKLLGGIASSAWSGAKHYAGMAGAGLLNGVRNATGTLLGKAKSWAKRKPAAACGCFVAGTLVWTTSGLIPIESVQPGVDQAITLNEATGLLEVHAITDLIVTEQSSLLRLTVIHESGHPEVIDTTDEHPFYEEARVGGWVRADGLSPGDVVRTMGGAAVVDALFFGNERVTVYNLTVADSHTYMIGPDATWVHNCRPVRHHWIPKVKDIRLWALARDIDVEDHVGDVWEPMHRLMHGNHRREQDYLARWRRFIRNRPNTSADEVMQFVEHLKSYYEQAIVKELAK
jgi:hypothetical protein